MFISILTIDFLSVSDRDSAFEDLQDICNSRGDIRIDKKDYWRSLDIIIESDTTEHRVSYGSGAWFDIPNELIGVLIQNDFNSINLFTRID